MDTTIEVSKTITNDAGRFRLVVQGDPGMSQAMASPREEYDHHVGVMVAHDQGYVLPSEGDRANTIMDKLRESDVGFRAVSRWLRMFHGATVVLPIYRAGGNELRLSAGTADDNGDGAAIGVIYDTPQTRREVWGDRMPAPVYVETSLRDEVEQYDVWSAGEMTAWEVQRFTGDEDADEDDDEVWEQLHNCGGYYSTEEAREQGMPELERIAADALAEHIEELHARALVENEQLGWTDARKGAERALAVLRQADPEMAEAELDHFGDGTLGIESLGNLVVDLLHLAYLNGEHPAHVTRSALNNWHEEVTEADIEVAAEAAEANQREG